MNKDVAPQRLKEIREELKLTQAQFGQALELSTSTADLERGKTRIPGRACMVLLRDYHINPLWLFGESTKKHLNPDDVDILPKAITVDQEGQENILLVNTKAAAGYGENLGDREYLEQLPAFTFPLPEYRNATFRGFQIKGDSMTPLVYPDDWILAEAVSSLDEIKDNEIYVIAQNDGLRLKQIQKTKERLKLLSLNPEYPPVTIETSTVLEIWQYHSKISFKNSTYRGITLEKVYQEVQDIKRMVGRKGE